MMSSDEKNAGIADWWAANPMTYGLDHGCTIYNDSAVELGSKEFFLRVDQEFYAWNRPLHGARPFDRLFPYDRFKGARVLEIGCGMGTMAMNWALAGAKVTAVDLNKTAIEQTRRRFKLMNLEARIEQCDAGELPFRDGEFDYAYSWGVLHHSPDLEGSLASMLRTVRDGGEFGLMLYNRHSLLHAYMTVFLEGFLHEESKFLGPLELASRYGDGSRQEGNPYTWPVTKRELRSTLTPLASNIRMRILGTDLDSILKYAVPGIGLLLPAWAKRPWARRIGWSLWAEGCKR